MTVKENKTTSGKHSDFMLKMKICTYRHSVGLKNKLKYGANGPEFGERIYINPKKHDSFIVYKNRGDSGQVIGGNWDLKPTQSIESLFKFKACRMHWINGVPWEETGIYEYLLDKIKTYGLIDDLRNLSEIKERYKKLDDLFEEIKESREFKTQEELDPSNFNEAGGVIFHINRNNIPIWNSGGIHRFFIAKLLKLDVIPAQLGVLHPKALKEWRRYKDKNFCLHR